MRSSHAAHACSLPYLPWHLRSDVIVSRFNAWACPWVLPLQIREKLEGEACARLAFVQLNASAENSHEGQKLTLDAGAYVGPEGVPKVEPIWPEQQARAKYALVLDGAAYAYRLRNVLLGGQAVIMDAQSAQYGWFYPALKPWVHYIPLGDQYKTIFELMRFLEAHDSLAADIAANGRVMGQAINRDTGFCYSRFLLEEYAKLLTFKPRVGKRAVLLKEGLSLLLRQQRKVHASIGRSPEQIAEELGSDGDPDRQPWRDI